jgi:two-component system nitrogen regulation sensor histidine kinase NtrY
VQELLTQAVFLQRVAQPTISFEVKSPKEPIFFEADGRLVSQALTNVLKNACEAIEARKATGDDGKGRVSVVLESDDERFSIRVIDNGIGLPPEHRHRLTEPYVTTRAKGTGLGLAIVRKIVEDHGGEIAIDDAPGQQGAQIRLTFPLRQKVLKDLGVTNEQERLVDSA